MASREELSKQYGSNEEAAKAIASGKEKLKEGDFEGFPSEFRDLIIHEQLKLTTE